MKKIFSIFTAALMSASMFAALEPAPDDATLNAFKTEGDNVVVAIFVEDSIKCSDMVFTGTYNGWSNDLANCKEFAAVKDFDGWYAVAFADATTGGDGICGKPVHLQQDGTFAWDYQVGDAELVRGTANVVKGGYAGEIDIKGYGTDVPVLLNVKAWKADPCAAIYHDYVITLISPDCNEDEYITPAISGGFNSWAQDSMALDAAATEARQGQQLLGAVYTFTAHAAEGTTYKFRSAASWGVDWTNELKEYDSEAGEWKSFNDGANFTFGTVTEIEYDLGDPTMYSWTNCERPLEEDSMTYTFTVVFPVCAAAAPNIIGSFCGWSGGVAMTLVSGTTYSASVRALPSNEFKFNDAVVGWDNEVMKMDTAWVGLPNMKFSDKADEQGAISLDYSDATTYCWKACTPTAVATVKAAKPAAKKVLVNGQMIIDIEGAKYNVLGVEMK